MRSKSYVINVTPIAWQRAQLNGKRFFDGQIQQKVGIGLVLSQQHGDESLFTKPITMNITFYMHQSKSNSEKYYHTTRPDLDNLEKFLLDAIKNVLISDDRIIWQVTKKKIYDKNPRVEFTITESE